MSDVIELVGMACLAGAAFLLAGLAAFLVVAGAELMLVGYTFDDSTARKMVGQMMVRVRVRRLKRRQRGASRRKAA